MFRIFGHKKENRAMTPPTAVDPSLLKKCPICNATVYKDPRNRTEANEYNHSEGCPMLTQETSKQATATKTVTIAGQKNTVQATKTVTATLTPNQPPASNFAISEDWWGKISCPFAAFLYANGTNNVGHKKKWTLDDPSQLPVGLVFSQFPPGAACIAGIPQGPGSQGNPFIVDITCVDEENGDTAHIAFEIYIDSLE